MKNSDLRRKQYTFVESLEPRVLLSVSSDNSDRFVTDQGIAAQVSSDSDIDLNVDHDRPRNVLPLSTIISVVDCGYDYPLADREPAEGCADFREGYTTRWSYDQGDVVEFHLSGSDAEPQRDAIATIYDAKNRPYMSFKIDELVTQDVRDHAPFKFGFGFEVTARVQLPENMPSGIYFLGKAGPSAARGGRQIPFIVRSNSLESDIVVVHGSNTANAYSTTGGKGNYSSPRFEPDPLISFQRPKNHNHNSRPIDKWFADKHDELDFRYISSTDMDNYSQLSGSDLMVLSGHAEYWSQKAVNNLDRFVAEGGELLILSGNVMYKEVRYCYADDRETNTPCDDIAANYVGDPDNDEPIGLRYYNTQKSNIERPASHEHVPAPRPYDEVRDSIGLSYDWGLRGANLCAPGRNNYEFDVTIPGCAGWSQLPVRGHGGYKFVDPDRPYLEGIELPRLIDRAPNGRFKVEMDEAGNAVRDPLQRGMVLNMFSGEYDGFPNNGLDTFPDVEWLTREEYNQLTPDVFETGFPIVDADYENGFHEFHLIAFDFGFAPNKSSNLRHLRMGGWIEFQRTPESGRVINVGGTDWGNYAFQACPDLSSERISTCVFKHGHEVQQITENMIHYLLDQNPKEPIQGDINQDGELDAHDINELSHAVRTNVQDVQRFDMNSDDVIDNADRLIWIQELARTNFGDANLDGAFTTSDLVVVFQAGEYDDAIDGNSGWDEGDWSGDGDFDSTDLVIAFTAGLQVNARTQAFDVAAWNDQFLLAPFELQKADSDGDTENVLGMRHANVQAKNANLKDDVAPKKDAVFVEIADYVPEADPINWVDEQGNWGPENSDRSGCGICGTACFMKCMACSNKNQ